MLYFLGIACPVVIGVMLAVSGLAHACRVNSLQDLLREHALLAPAACGPIAVALTAVELGLGAGALWVLATGRWGLVLAPATVALSLAFVGYVVALLRRGPSDTSCGCTPLASPLTEASLVPPLTLLAAGLLLGAAQLLEGPGAGVFHAAQRLLAVTAGLAVAGAASARIVT